MKESDASMKDGHGTNHQSDDINWLAMSILIIGAFMSILDSSIVNVALPKIMSVFSAQTSDIQWVLTSYMLVLGVVVPVTGYLGDRYGYKTMYIVSLIIFTAGSALCGLAWSTWAMVGFRVIQGIGGGMIMPLTMSMVYQVVPRHKIGFALGIWGIAAMAAPALGPTMGGYLVDYFNWRMIYTINVPIGIAAIILGFVYLDETAKNADLKFDFTGFVFSSIGLFCLLFALSEGTDKGWTSPFIITLLVISFFSLFYFVVHELRVEDPMLDLRLMKNMTFTGSMLLSTMLSIAMFGGMFLVPLYMQNFRQFSAVQTGELMMPSGIAAGIMMPISGKLYDKIGARPLVFIGLIVIGTATLLFHKISMETAYDTIMFWLVLRSLGMGLSMMPAMNAGLSVVPTNLIGRASALSNLVRQVSGSFGVAIVTTLLTERQTYHLATSANAITPQNSVAMQAINYLQHIFTVAGMELTQAKGAALALMSGLLTEQSFIMAMDDAFLFMTAIAFISLIPVVMLKEKKSKKGQPFEIQH